ncbi:DUF6470 family protein [Halarsenatibacter silvermanii]|uniref:Uncharacterized protein n=1 Tax=Halarsenatibacter silvermanii TaxID=321763 RepID=A0A1G9M0M5_9FIRM|nr:DUF6470 family protein [Halarsenatibacter silvermanii]SDL67693.1 hypothetical protein SAMN04488692_10767 [Halarsenatibacter silvermanii]
MDISSIQINQQSGQLGIDIQPHQLEIEGRLDRLEITSDSPQVQLESQSININIDMTEMRQDMGIYNFSDRMQMRVQESFEVALEAIGRYGEIGDRLMDFQNNDIADIAFEEMLDDDVRVEVEYLSPPEFQVEGPELELNLDPAQYEAVSEGEGRLNRPEYRFEPGSINIYLRQEPGMEIIPPGSEVDERA